MSTGARRDDEFQPLLPTAEWRRSSRSGSGGEGDECVEVAGTGAVVAVRDSKDPDGPKLIFTRTVWAAFVAEVQEH